MLLRRCCCSQRAQVRRRGHSVSSYAKISPRSELSTGHMAYSDFLRCLLLFSYEVAGVCDQ